MKQKQIELADEEPPSVGISSHVWTRRSGVVSFCPAMAEMVGMENTKRNGWPGGGKREE